MFRLPLLCVALVLFALPQPARAGDPLPDPVRVFEITGGGKVEHPHTATTLGAKSFVSKVNKKSISSCVTGTDGGGCNLIPNSKEGKVYLFIYSSSMWGIATDPTPDEADVTTMEGVIDGKGKFMFVGTEPDTGTTFLVEGKAKLDKEFGNDLVPLKLKGKLRALDISAGHTGVANVKTVGKPLVIEV